MEINNLDVKSDYEVNIENEDESPVKKPTTDDGKPPSKFDTFLLSYLDLKNDNPYFKFSFHLLAFTTFFTIGFNTPLQLEMYPNLDISCAAIYILNFFLYSFDIFAKLKLYGFSRDEKSFFKSFWTLAQFVFSIFLIVSAVFQILQIFGIIYDPYIIQSFSRVPLSIILILLIPDYVNLDLGGIFTPEALIQLGKVLFFSVYFYIIFAVLGVQLIGGVNGVCLLSGTDDTNIGDQRFATPFIHCNLYDSSIGNRCPLGFECYDQRLFSVSDGNLYFASVFQGIMFVYEGSIQDGWSTQYTYSIQSAGLLVSSIYYISLILFSAWLVRNVFVAVITQVLGEALENDPPVKEFNLRRANFGLSLMFENEKTDLKDCNVNKKSDGKFGIILKDMLDSVVFSLFISCLLITDTVLLALIGIIYQWQIFLAIVFFIEPILRLVALGFKHFSVIEWVVYEFLIPTMNVVAVALNYFDYYYLDVIYAIRLIRIISVHGIIFDYIKRILGNYARFGASLVLAIAFLIILSSLSLQIFCGIPTLADSTVTVLGDFPNTFIDIFIIFLQGGAFSTMLSLANMVTYNLYFFVMLFFVGCHFFSNTIMMSIFITFILANLELTEEEIKEMQKEIKISFDPLDDYAGRSIETQVVRLSDNLTEDFVLPLRFKIYKKFKNSPPPALVPIQFRKSNFPNVNKNFMAAYLSEDYPVYEERLYVMENIRPEPDAMKKYFISKNFGFTQEDAVQKYNYLDFEGAVEFIRNLNVKVSPLHTPTLKGKKLKIAVRATSSGDAGAQSTEEKEILILQQKITNTIQMRRRIIDNLREQHPNIDKTLFIFDSNNILRKSFGYILNFKYVNKVSSSSIGEILASQTYFEWIMIILTIASTILMMLETNENMVFDNFYTTIFEYCYVSINMIEVLMRMISQGLLLTPSAICNETSGVLNICTALIGLIHSIYFLGVSSSNIFLNLNSYTSVAIFLRVARCLRPIRIIILSGGLFRIIVLLVGGWKNIAKVLCLLLTLLLFFTYFGYMCFKGRLNRCNDDSITDISGCIENFTALLSGVPVSSNDPNYNSSAFSILVPRVVVGHSRFDFDNFLSAYLSSYIMMTLDSWTSGLDYVKQMVGSWVTLYFYAYVFFANLIGVSMFVGVVCQSYNINNGIALLTKDQRSWSDLTQRIDLTSPVFVPQRPLEKFRAILYDVATSFPYRIFHTLVICISPTALLIYALNDPDLHEEHYIIFIIIFACHIIFFIDIILKIISFGFITYFKGTVNKCDTLIIISMIISSALEIFTQYRDNVILSYVIISAITIELILLSTRWDALKDLMLTFIMSVVKSLTAITVMFIIMVTYSLIGNVLFGRLKFGLTTNRYFNYRTSFNALLILFILATGDNWSAYMLDSSIEPPFCTFDANAPIKTDCGSKIGAVIYFISYLLIIQQAILNLFIATVLSNFAVFCASDEINGRFKPSDITTYLTMWNKYDKQQNSEISRNYARMLCLEYFKLKQYTTTEDIYVLFQLYEQLDREIKAAYLNEDDQRADNDDFKKEGKISFRNLMLLLATKLANIKASFKTNDLLSKLALEEDITENVSATLIAKWYNYIKSYKKTGVLDVQNQTIRLQTDRLADNEILDAKKDESGLLKFDSDSLKRELEQIEQDSPTTNTEQIDEFCTWWHDRYLEAISSKKIN